MLVLFTVTHASLSALFSMAAMGHPQVVPKVLLSLPPPLLFGCLATLYVTQNTERGITLRASIFSCGEFYEFRFLRSHAPYFPLQRSSGYKVAISITSVITVTAPVNPIIQRFAFAVNLSKSAKL